MTAAETETRVVRSSIVLADPSEVWSRVVSPEGINFELGPWLRMTVPAGLAGASIDDVVIGEPLGRSWVLLFGLVPVDYDDICVAELEPGRRFLERSRMLSMTLWQHERVVEAESAGRTRVTDRLTFRLRPPLARTPFASRVAKALVSLVFGHRHRRLRKSLDAMKPLAPSELDRLGR